MPDQARAGASRGRRAPSVAAAQPRVTIRHYCQGIGDSHLLIFPRANGTAFRVLIDCGLHSIVKGGTDLIDAIAADIKATIGDNRIDVLVVTHEHWDHVSGFLTAKEIFATIEFGEVWMPWTEKPGDPLADELDTYRGQAIAALGAASDRLAARGGLSKHLGVVRRGLDSLLGFYFGAKGDKVRTARNAAVALAGRGKSPSYLEPRSPPLTVPDLPLRVFVLGPPRDRALLKLEERATEMYQLNGPPGWAVERRLSAGLAFGAGGSEAWVEAAVPFDTSHGEDLEDVLAGKGGPAIRDFVSAHYTGLAARPPDTEPDAHLADQSWRRIDDDWLGMAADLAMQIDNGVNNTSLVLAFEFTDTRRVLLFPGDAQIGSWMSWQELAWPLEEGVVTAKDLLARTVYLKVAHHGSQNATPPRLGLDLMTSPDLSAFVPVNTDDARKAQWHEMPFGTIMTHLAAKTAGRLIRADDPWVAKAAGTPPFATPSGSILAVRNEGRGWVELDIA